MTTSVSQNWFTLLWTWITGIGDILVYMYGNILSALNLMKPY